MNNENSHYLDNDLYEALSPLTECVDCGGSVYQCACRSSTRSNCGPGERDAVRIIVCRRAVEAGVPHHIRGDAMMAADMILAEGRSGHAALVTAQTVIDRATRREE